jgi:glucose-6-phosphate isomerase
MGTVDQHSQLQLYLDGPHDKFFSVVMTNCAGSGETIQAERAGGIDLGALEGRTMGDLFDASQRATMETLADGGRPVRIFTVEAVDAATMGALMMHFMLETIIAADLLDLDPFDQPAVEQSKILAKQYLTEMASR